MSLSYFENLLLGLRDILDNTEGVIDSNLDRNQAATFSEITIWEQKHGVFLTEEIRTFYTSSNGYLFEWLYTFSGKTKNGIQMKNDNQPKNTLETSNNDDYVRGKIAVNSLSKLVPVYGFDVNNTAEISHKNQRYSISLSVQSKVFLLETTYAEDKIVLIYLHPKYIPTIWLMTTNTFHHLADDLVTYLKMAVAHLGIPNWQLVYTPEGLPTWTEKIFRLLAPHLLPFNDAMEMTRKDNRENCSLTNSLNVNLYKNASFLQSTTATCATPHQLPDVIENPKASHRKKGKTGKPIRKPLYYIKK